jgi:hypothetical protein
MMDFVEAVNNESDVERLARWFNLLNGWEWPEDLPGKPEGFEDLPDVMRPPLKYCAFGSKSFFVTPLMRLIESRIGYKATLRWHHMHNLGRGRLRFELWWLFRHVRVWRGNLWDHLMMKYYGRSK